MTYDYNTRMRTIYYNGNSIRSGVATAHFTPSNPAITVGLAGAETFKGSMDELRWFGSAMSGSEIWKHYNGNFFGAPTPLYWLKFNEGGGDVAADSSGAGRAAGQRVGNGGDVSWKSATDNQKCVSGYWVGYMLERVSAASVPVGTQSIYRIYQMDNCQRMKHERKRRCPLPLRDVEVS